MKGKKYKRSAAFIRKIYEKAFGIRQPYQILVDAELCREALRSKVVVKDLATEVLGGATKIMVSQCVVDELKRMDGAGIGGEAMRGSVFIAKRFELRSCRHKPSMTSAECIKDLIGADNLNHYGVAGQDLELRKALREILGVPLLFINRGLLLMEDPSRATREHAHRVEKQKLGMNEFEKKTLSALPTGEAVGGMIDGAGRKKKTTEAKKKKKAKKGKSQPNSLSRKKSARPVEKLAAPSASESKQHKPKRQRRPKKRTCNHASGETASNPNAAVE